MRITDEQLMQFTTDLANDISKNVFERLDVYIALDPSRRAHINPAFPFPKSVIIKVLKDHMIIEYFGPENEDESQVQFSCQEMPEESIMGYLGLTADDYSHAIALPPVSGMITNHTMFLGDSIERLIDFNYDVTKVASEFIQFNGLFDLDRAEEPTMLSNVTYFWSSPDSDFHVRHIDFMEIYPLDDEGIISSTVEGYMRLADWIIDNPVPYFDVKLHQALNNLVELISLSETTEPQITRYLEENPGILQLAFGCRKLHPQTLLEWQYDKGLANLKPDFELPPFFVPITMLVRNLSLSGNRSGA